MAAKRMTSCRLDVDLLEWAEGYGRERGVSRSAVLEGGLRALRGLAEGGVPELAVSVPVAAVKRPPVPPMLGLVSADALAKQARLNAAKDGRGGR